MKLWQQPAQRLPVKVRPLRLETLTSYTTRLATTNELTRPTILIRALGQPHRNLAGTTLHDYDLALNPLALARLETFTGIPVTRLRMSLPAVNYQNHLPSAPEIITAHRRYIRLRDRVAADHEEGIETGSWFWRKMITATNIARGWVRPSHFDHHRLHEVWQTATVGSDMRAFPEAVAPAEITTDLTWRRHATMARYEHDPGRFFRRVALRLGADTAFFDGPAGTPAPRTHFSTTNPLRHWANNMRRKHETYRAEFYARPDRPGFHEQPFPEIHHFK